MLTLFLLLMMLGCALLFFFPHSSIFHRFHLCFTPLPFTSLQINAEDATWVIEDGRTVTINLPKVNTMEWWKSVVKGEQEIDLSKVVPEDSKLDDLDGETRQMVEKMMFDQKAKALGQKTSEERQKEQMLAKFKAMHPELDFSNAKIC